MASVPQNPRVQVTLIDFTKSDEDIFELVSENHTPNKDKRSFVLSELLEVTGLIIVDATESSNTILQPTNAHGGTVKGNSTLNSPLCLLKSIACEMSSCKTDPVEGEISVLQRTQAILKKLSKYSFEEKAVVALAAFALEYGDLWHFALCYGQSDQRDKDQLANSLAILKRVPVVQQRMTEIKEINNLIMHTYYVIDNICKVEGLFKDNDPKDVPTLKTAMKSIPVHIYWSILSIVACAVNINHLTDEEKPHDLSQLAKKIKEILEKLKELYGSCVDQIGGLLVDDDAEGKVYDCCSILLWMMATILLATYALYVLCVRIELIN